MTNPYHPTILNLVQTIMPSIVAAEILGVQPMDMVSDAFKKMIETAPTEEELVAAGFEPVSNLGLMWTKAK